MSSTDSMVMRYAVEESYGELASGGQAFQNLVITSETLTTQFNTIESEGVLGDRQLRDLVRVGTVAQGDINAELSYTALDDLLTGALCDAWLSNVIENGSDKVSFAFEKDFSDLTQFYAFRGCRVGGLQLNFELRRQIRAVIGVMGRGGVFAGSTIGTGAPTAAPDNPMMATLSKLVIDEAATPIDDALGFSIELDNQLREKRVLGSDALRDINLGQFRLTGTLRAYFEDRRYIDKLVADTASDFEIVTEDADGNSYVWTFPRFKFTGLTGPGNSGRSQDVIQELTWTAMRDPSTGITARVERSAA
jgi:hypothetical protein